MCVCELAALATAACGKAGASAATSAVAAAAAATAAAAYQRHISLYVFVRCHDATYLLLCMRLRFIKACLVLLILVLLVLFAAHV